MDKGANVVITGGDVCLITKVVQEVDITGIDNHQIINLTIVTAGGVNHKKEKYWSYSTNMLMCQVVRPSTPACKLRRSRTQWMTNPSKLLMAHNPSTPIMGMLLL